MSDWRVSGAGSTDYNGDYLESGTHSGQPAYLQTGAGGVWLWFESGTNTWVISPTKGEAPPNYIYQSGGGTGVLPDDPWGVGAAGTLPAPSVTVIGALGRFSITIKFGDRGKVFADGLYIHSIDSGASVIVGTESPLDTTYTKTTAAVISTGQIRVSFITFNPASDGDVVEIYDGSDSTEILTLKGTE